MKRLLGVLMMSGAIVGLVASGSAIASYHGGSSGYSAPKKVYKPKVYAPKKVYPAYTGDYPSAECYGEQTYEPPFGYAPGCEPPAEWLAYCDARWRSFNEDNGYYLSSSGYYRYCTEPH